MIVHSFDIGGSSVKSGIVDVTQKLETLIITARTAPIATRMFTEYEKVILGEVADGQARQPAPTAVAVSTTGQLSADGTMLKSGLIQGYDGVSWARILAEPFGHLPVTIITDGQASTLAEYYANGSGDPHVHAVVGTGVGGGIVSGGEQVLLPERSGGRLGHVRVSWESRILCSCGSRGCCEPLAAAPAIVRLYNSAAPAGQRRFNLQEITASARAGDQLALSAFERSGSWLGIALGVVLNALTPAVITIGGGVALASEAAGSGGADPYLAGIERGLRTACPAHRAVTPRRGKLGNDAGIIGAALAAARQR